MSFGWSSSSVLRLSSGKAAIVGLPRLYHVSQPNKFTLNIDLFYQFFSFGELLTMIPSKGTKDLRRKQAILGPGQAGDVHDDLRESTGDWVVVLKSES